jgi:hypothetical protein
MDKGVSLTVFASTKPLTMRYPSILLRRVIAIVLFGTFASSYLFCQDRASDPESYKLKIGGQFWYATPIATVAGSGTQVPISFDKVLGFSTYSTFTSGLDWHFKRKHHLLFIVSPNQTTRTAVLNQTITFKNLTFQTGSSVAGTLRTNSFAPGYRYDIIHRPRGHLGIVAQINLLNIKATLTGVAIQSSTQTSTSTASGSLFAPLPVFGPEGRAYFARNRLYIGANLKGMFFLDTEISFPPQERSG